MTSGQHLRDFLEQRRRRNPAYSVRAFARDLGLSPGYLSELLADRKVLSIEKARAVAQKLSLKGRILKLFLKSVALGTLTSDSEVQRLVQEAGAAQEYVDLELDRFQYFNNWYHVAIMDLASCHDFEPDPQHQVAWIAGRLGLSSEQAHTAVARLIRLGLMSREKGRLVKIGGSVAIPTRHSSQIVVNFHQQMIKKAQEELGNTEGFPHRHISGITFAFPRGKVAEAKEKIAAFKREIAELNEGEVCEEVYQMNIQFFPLTRRKTS